MRLTGVTPTSATGGRPTPAWSARGGTAITLTGSGFSTLGASPVVRVGLAVATGVSVVNDTTLTCVVPAGPTGRVDLEVRGAAGSAVLLQSFTNP